MGASLQAAVSTVALQPLAATKLRPTYQSIFRPFDVEPLTSRVSCSLHDDLKNLTLKCVEATKIAGFSLATSALVVSGANAEGVPKRLTFDEIQSKTYMEVKGTGTANQCPTIEGGLESFAIKPGKYYAKKFCLEPTSFTVKAEGVSKNSMPDFQNIKLMTRLTYTLDEIEGPFEVASDGTVKFLEKDGIDYAAVTVKLPGGERVPFLFTIKQLVASGKPESFEGDFLVPSYRGSSFLDLKGRGVSTGYDNAVALPARGDDEELAKENNKNTAASLGFITLSVTESNPDSGVVLCFFESIQPSDTDLGAKTTPKDVKIKVFVMGLVTPWSVTLALIEAYSFIVQSLPLQVTVLSVIVSGDFVLSFLSLGGACSTASVAVLLIGAREKDCDRYKLSATMAFLSSFLSFASTFFNFRLLPSLVSR